MMQESLESVIASWEGGYEVLPRKAYWALMQEWRCLFARSYYAKTGRWQLGAYNWHVFSYEYAHALNGQKALYEYLQQPVVPFYILPEERESLPAYLCSASFWPDLRGLIMDLYVSPEDFAWTMAFTHEANSGLGPYFCRREWMESAAGGAP